jgi:hypothetical protein
MQVGEKVNFIIQRPRKGGGFRLSQREGIVAEIKHGKAKIMYRGKAYWRGLPDDLETKL